MGKILVVDDSPTIVAMATEVLTAGGHQVLSATDGVAALEAARQEKPDLIILDVMLPKMDGYQVCRMLKFEGTTEKIPIIMFTSRSGEEDKSISRDVKADDFVSKDFDPDKLLAVVNKHLAAKK